MQPVGSLNHRLFDTDFFIFLEKDAKETLGSLSSLRMVSTQKSDFIEAIEISASCLLLTSFPKSFSQYLRTQ